LTGGKGRRGKAASVQCSPYTTIFPEYDGLEKKRGGKEGDGGVLSRGPEKPSGERNGALPKTPQKKTWQLKGKEAEKHSLTKKWRGVHHGGHSQITKPYPIAGGEEKGETEGGGGGGGSSLERDASRATSSLIKFKNVKEGGSCGRGSGPQTRRREVGLLE